MKDALRKDAALLALALLLGCAGLRGTLTEILALQVALLPPDAEYVALVKAAVALDPNLVVIAIFIAPLLEELGFRWLAFYILTWGNVRGVALILITTALFAAVHPPHNIPAAVVLGLITGHVYLQTRNIAWPIVAHFFWNLGAVVDAFFLGPFFSKLIEPGFTYSATHFPAAYVVVSMLAAAAGMALYVLSLRMRRAASGEPTSVQAIGASTVGDA